MIIDERASCHERAIAAARMMLTAARTAPKARGVDIIEAAIVDGDDLLRLSDAMKELHQKTGRPVYLRDSENIKKGECVVLIGTHPHPMGLDCAHCGFATCAEKPVEVPCAVNCTDVGIALGSACAMAADLRLDTRVMFSVGMGAEALGLLDGCGQVYAISVSVSSKSPFFDR